MKVPNVILEREPDITTDPRGIALDEDGIRMLQAIGVYDQIYTDIGRSTFGAITRVRRVLTSSQAWTGSISLGAFTAI
jgi:2-polyprenyl-6-methoxyphenol hydroxylase-like FAD-dependent oxidoreductase